MSYLSNPYEIERSAIARDTREDVYYTFNSIKNVEYISYECTRRLVNVHPDGKNIVVGRDQILSVMDSVYSNSYRDVVVMTMMTIGILVDHISAEFAMERQNSRLSAWVQNFGPETGLRQHSKIKLREGGPTRMQFNMNY